MEGGVFGGWNNFCRVPLNAIKSEMGNQDFGVFGVFYRLSMAAESGENSQMNSEKILRGLEKAGVAKARRHLFLCIGPECCPPEEGERLWERVKDRVRQSGLEVMRTKAACFRICTGGPWLAVYPDGIWYGEVNPERFERIWAEHICEDKPVEEWMAAVSPLRGCGQPAPCSKEVPGPQE
jgi:(2Fe-2S) ferredoxin